MKENYKWWGKSFFLAMLGGWFITLLLYPFSSNYGHGFIAWKISFLLLIIYIAFKLKVKLITFFGSVFASFILYAMIGSLLPDKFIMIEHNYLGLSSINPDMFYDAQDAGVSLTPEVIGIYKKEDPSIKEIVESFKVDGDVVSGKKVIFWQTAAVYNFPPIEIKEYYGWWDKKNNNLKKKKRSDIYYFFNIGFFAVLEAFINGLFSYFFILMTFVISYFVLIKKHLFWESFD